MFTREDKTGSRELGSIRRRPRLLMRGLAATVVMLLLATASPASASDSISASKTSTCKYFGIENHKAQVLTYLSATDHGSYVSVNPGSYAQMAAFYCSTGGVRATKGHLTWTLTAHGAGLDGCSLSIPSSIGCSGGFYERSVQFDIDVDVPNTQIGYKRKIGTSEILYFKDGSVGDIDYVCTSVRGVINGVGITTPSACASAD